MLEDNNPNTFIDNRANPPAGSGLAPASSETFNAALLKAAGYPVVPYTINDKARMLELMRLGVNGIISDRPDVLRRAVEEFDANDDGTPGDFIDANGLINLSVFDAQGHRGARNLRPENTLPAMEVALDHLISTLETNTGITADGVPVLNHDPHIQAQKCRRPDGAPYTEATEVLVKDLTATLLQSTFICDKIFRGSEQQHDLVLSPISVAFVATQGLPHAYVMPTLPQLFDFVDFYVKYYDRGPGKSHLDAKRRLKNAQRVRFNIETKSTYGRSLLIALLKPSLLLRRWRKSSQRTGCKSELIFRASISARCCSCKSTFPKSARFICLVISLSLSILRFLDQTMVPIYRMKMVRILHGWPYRVTRLDHPFRAQRSGGFEGIALNPAGTTLFPLLEQPLAQGQPRTLLIHEFDIASRQYTGARFVYPLDIRGSAIGDFVLFDANRGLVIEHDGSQGNLDGFKAVYEIKLNAPGMAVSKSLAIDLLRITDPHGISGTNQRGDVGLGSPFAFPFTTIEDVVVFDTRHIGVLNDNNFPFSVGRHVGTSQPDDNEFVVIELDQPLGTL